VLVQRVVQSASGEKLRQVATRTTEKRVGWGIRAIRWRSFMRKCIDGTGSGSCSMASYGINGVKPSGSATRGLVNW